MSYIIFLIFVFCPVIVMQIYNHYHLIRIINVPVLFSGLIRDFNIGLLPVTQVMSLVILLVWGT